MLSVRPYETFSIPAFSLWCLLMRVYLKLTSWSILNSIIGLFSVCLEILVPVPKYDGKGLAEPKEDGTRSFVVRRSFTFLSKKESRWVQFWGVAVILTELRFGCSSLFISQCFLSIDVGIELVWPLTFLYVFFMKRFTKWINIFGISVLDTITYSVKYSMVFCSPTVLDSSSGSFKSAMSFNWDVGFFLFS